MPQDDLAFEVDELSVGQNAEDVRVVAGSYDPAASLLDRNAGTLYLRTNGETWLKKGTGTNEWERLPLDSDFNADSILEASPYDNNATEGIVACLQYDKNNIDSLLLAGVYNTGA